MPTDYCPDHKEHARAINAHDKRLDSHSADIDRQRVEQFEMRIAIQQLTDIQQQMQALIVQNEQALERQDARISAIEDRPAHDAQRVKDSILAAAGGAVGTGVVAMVVLQLAQQLNIM